MFRRTSILISALKVKSKSVPIPPCRWQGRDEWLVIVTPRPLLIPGKGLRAGLETEARGKILYLCRGSEPVRPVIQSISAVNKYNNWAFSWFIQSLLARHDFAYFTIAFPTDILKSFRHLYCHAIKVVSKSVEHRSCWEVSSRWTDRKISVLWN
jgi:hypothetical protein